MRIIFVRILNDDGHAYDWASGITKGSHSYTDFWKLVRLSGFETCDLHEVDFDSDNCYLFAPRNGNSDAALNRPHKCRLIFWSLERPPFEMPPYADEIWISDQYFAFLKSKSDPRVKYIPLGGHPKLGGEPRFPKIWGFAHLSYLSGAREARTNSLAEGGFSIAPNAFGLERDYILAHSRFGLALHQTPDPIIEPLRYVLFACWKIPIVAEESRDYFPYQVIRLKDDKNPTAAEMNAIDEGFLSDMVENNYAMVTKTLTFRGCVETAVSEPERILE